MCIDFTFASYLKQRAIKTATLWGLAFASIVACVQGFASTSPGKESEIPSQRPSLPEFRTFGLTEDVRGAMADAGIYDGRQAERGVKKPEGKGDLVVYLATLTDGKKVSRWIVQLQTMPPTETQSESSPVKLYSSTGNDWMLSRKKETIEVTVLRPLAKKKTTRLLLADQDALNAGLWGFVATNLKLKDIPFHETAYEPKFGNSPFSEDQIRSERPFVLARGITPAEELSKELAIPALGEFLSLIVATPELFQMMTRVIDVSPSMALKGLGTIDLDALPYDSIASGKQFGLADEEKVYVLPLSISVEKKTLLLCQLALVPPRAPFQVGAGLLALAVGRPDGNGPLLTMEFIGGRSGSSR